MDQELMKKCAKIAFESLSNNNNKQLGNNELMFPIFDEVLKLMIEGKMVNGYHELVGEMSDMHQFMSGATLTLMNHISKNENK